MALVDGVHVADADFSLLAIDLDHFVEASSFGGAYLETRRRLAVANASLAQRALLENVRSLFDVARIVGASRHAQTATDAQILVDEDSPVLGLERRTSRTSVDTGRVIAVHAETRHKCRVANYDLFVFFLEELDPVAGTGRSEVVGGDTGDLACPATYASRDVDTEFE
ncbi:MAG: hypothetical protein ABFR53_05340 [Actinomycetota bacterium]